MYKPQDFRIINAHAHIFPEKIAEKASRAIGDFYDIGMRFAGGRDILLADGEPFGIEQYLVCSTATTPAQVVSINSFIAAECASEPRFIGFCSLHPQMENARGELERAISLGLKGIKLHPDFQRFNIDDPAAYQIYEAAEELSLPILFHSGDDRHDFSNPARLANIAKKYPDLICIAAHFGGYRRWDEAARVIRGFDNIYFDTSSSLEFITTEHAKRLISAFGDDRFFFGTDYPMWSHAGEFERLFALDLTHGQYEKIFRANFAKVLRLP